MIKILLHTLTLTALLLLAAGCRTAPQGSREVTTMTYETREETEIARMTAKIARLEDQRVIEQLVFDSRRLQWEKSQLDAATREGELKLEVSHLKDEVAQLQRELAQVKGEQDLLIRLEMQQKEIAALRAKEEKALEEARIQAAAVEAQRRAQEQERLALERKMAEAAEATAATVGQVKGTLKVAAKVGEANFSQVMIRLTQEGKNAPLPRARHTVEMSDKKFLPKFLMVRPGDEVVFRNLDPFKHNVFSLSESNKFDLGLYESGTAPGYVFEKEGLVKVYCNVHPEMACFVMVTDAPWIFQTDGTGQYSFDALEEGHYTFYAWSVRGDYEKEIFVKGGQTLKLDFTIDGSRYSGPAHSNKFGKAYPNRARNERY